MAGKGAVFLQEQDVLCDQLDTVNTTLIFLVIVIASILLSFWATVRQRQAVCLSLQGEDEAAGQVGDVYAIRALSSALILGSLGYFLCLALRLLADSSCGVSRTSAQANLWASILVLCAAIVRWRDLNRVRAASERAAADLAGETGTLADTLVEP